MPVLVGRGQLTQLETAYGASSSPTPPGTSGSYAPAEAIARSALTQLGAGAEPLQHAFGASQLLFGARTAIASANLVATVLPAVWAVVRPTSGTITGRRPVAGLRLRPGTGSSGRRRLT